MKLRIFLAPLAALILLTGCDPDGERRSRRGDNTGDGDEQMTGGDGEGREYGDGDYAIRLSGSGEPSKYCWYIKETVHIWSDGSNVHRSDSAEDLCVEGGVECTANEPMGHTEETESSYLRVGYTTVGYGALYGTCEHLDKYWSDDESVECLFHKHCYGGRECVDYLCVCPEGVECMEQTLPGPAGEPDAGVIEAPDAGEPDAAGGQPDSGQSDSGQSNNNPPDAGRPDSGQSNPGPGGPDAATPDAGAPIGPPGG